MGSGDHKTRHHSAGEHNEHSYQASAFVGYFDDVAGVVKGNPCCLVPGEHKPVDLPDFLSPHTVCQSWPLSVESRYVEVRCVTEKKQLIQCCGHGLLASAAWWLGHWGGSDLLLKMNGQDVLCEQRGDQLWLRFSRLLSEVCEVPAWSRELWPESPVKAALAGDDEHYMVLQWPDNFSLDALSRPDERLAQFTQRAVICTSRQTSGPFDIQLRYFAPQYGVQEDPATGSAMRVLTDYWLSPGGNNLSGLRALQCSEQRGVLWGRLEQDAVWVGGCCIIDDKVP